MMDVALTRRDIMRRAAGAALACAAGGLFGCEPNPPLRIAVQPWVGYQFIFLAGLEGWLPSDGLQLLETKNNPESIAALVENRVDGAALTLDGVLSLRDQGIAVSAVMVFDVSAGADAVLAKPDIQSLAGLKGKRIGVEASSLGAIMLAKALDAGGLKQEELTVESMDFDHVATWDGGDLDAIITYEPALSQLLARGLVRIFDSRSLPQMIVDVLAVRPEVAERSPHALRGLIAAHFQALRLWHSNPIDTAYRLATRLGVKPDGVKNVFKGLDLPDALYNRQYLAAPAAELTRSAEEMAQIMASAGMLKNPLRLDNLFLPDYLPGEGG
ncbi:MAG: ABC transporter substrate-binding protein [Candidatus Methylumidiphilus sp.]